MRRNIILTLIAMLALSALPFFGQEQTAQQHHTQLGKETVRYKVMFKWGLINKRAGTAILTLTPGEDHYSSMLTANSEPWADNFYRVRDTLIGRMELENYKPLYYEKKAHESNEFKHDIVEYDYSTDGITAADCIRKVFKKGKIVRDETRRLESDNKTVDMLTSFYYMRSLPFQNWKAGYIDTADIFSGKQKERLSIVYHGIQNLEIDGKKYHTYYITFKFTSKNGAKTSDDMSAWITADSLRLPVKMEGKLPVGKVQCFITNK